MKTNVPVTFLLLKRELTVKHLAYEKALTGGMEKASAWGIYHIPQQPRRKLIYESDLFLMWSY